MLVFISDLHLTDGTAGVQFLPAKVFDTTLREIARQATHAKAKEVILVFLGDIFDVVRTTAWFKQAPAARPWDIPTPAPDVLEVQALRQLNAVAAKNQEIFDLWQRPLLELGFPVEPIRVYIPGNHDRICNQFESLRQRVEELLGMVHNPEGRLRRVPNTPFPHLFISPEYRVFARHGHEFDYYNCETGQALSGSDFAEVPEASYLAIPIGEVIACELASKLAVYVRQELEAIAELSPEERDQIADRLKVIDDVRPMGALLTWLLSQILPSQSPYGEKTIEAIKRGIDRVIEEFDALPFVQQWFKSHDHLLIDKADQLQWGLVLLRSSSLERLRSLVEPFEKLRTLLPNDNFAGEATDEFKRLDRWIGGFPPETFLYVLYGHTHTAAQVPIDATRKGDSARQGQARVYFNTGTWRPAAQQAREKTGFLSWKRLTFTLFYHPQHDPSSPAATAGYPTFETWSGSLLEVGEQGKPVMPLRKV